MMKSRWERLSDDESAGTAAFRFAKTAKWVPQPDQAQEMFDPLDVPLDRGDGCLAANLEYVVKCDSGMGFRSRQFSATCTAVKRC